MISIVRLQKRVNHEINTINAPFSIIIIDIDFFIRYCMKFSKSQSHTIMDNVKNFLYGELGDKKVYSANDSDEFFVICKNYNNDNAMKLAGNLLDRFRKQRFAHFLDKAYQSIRMTFSAGIASYPQNGEKSVICKKAMAALFMAKSLRRNNVQTYNEETVIHNSRKLLSNDISIDSIIGRWGEAGQTNRQVSAYRSLLWEPQAIAVSPTGELYIADQNNHQILCYNGKYVKPVLGTGQYGGITEGIPVANGRLNKPTGLFVSEDKLYITDTGNDIVIMLNLETNRLYNICGIGEAGYQGDGDYAKRATLNKPGGIVLDKDKNIYINDIANNVIRKIDNFGIIRAFAGNGRFGYSGDFGTAKEASFNEIYGICIDAKGENIYIADYFNQRIRKINIESNIITTVVGNGSEGYHGDGGDPTKAALNRPVAVCLDEYDNIYIAESGNQSVRMVAAKENRIYTLVGGCGTGTGQDDDIDDYKLANPNSLAVYNDNLYILDGANNRICKMTIPSLAHSSRFL